MISNTPHLTEFLGETDPIISGDVLIQLREKMGLTRIDFARIVGLSDRSVANWEDGSELKQSSLRTIVEIARLYSKLSQSFTIPEELATWLKTPNKAFGGSSPIQVIERGEIDRLWRMVYFLESGSPS